MAGNISESPVSVVAPSSSGWSTETYAIYVEALRRADEKFDEERDRRYTEVGVEREKALKIKETADLAALGLAREIQTYKDEKANELREQIGAERGIYVTRAELKPLADYVQSQTGRTAGVLDLRTVMISLAIIVIGLLNYFKGM